MINSLLHELGERPVRGRLRRLLAGVPAERTAWTRVGLYRSPRTAATMASRLRTGAVDGICWQSEWRTLNRTMHAVYCKAPFHDAVEEAGSGAQPEPGRTKLETA